MTCKVVRTVFLFAVSLITVINASAQFTTQQGSFLYALNSERHVFDLSPDHKLAVSLENDPIAVHPALLTSFDPIAGTEFDHKTFGFGPLEVRIAQTSAGLRVVALTSQGGPRTIFLFELSNTGQLTQITSTQLTTSSGDAGSNMVLSGNADVGFVVVSGGELLTFSLLNGAVLNRLSGVPTGTLALTEANGKRVLAVHAGTLRLMNVINPIQPVVLGEVSFPTNGEFSGSAGAPPVFTGDGKYVFATSQFTDFGVVDVDAVQLIATIGGSDFRFTRVSLFEDGQRRLLALQSTLSGTVNTNSILLVDAIDPFHLVILKEFNPTETLIYKSGTKFSKNGNRLFVQSRSKLVTYNLPSFTKVWEKDAPQAFREHQIEVYGDDEILAAWDADRGLGVGALFGAFPSDLPNVSINDATITEGDSGTVSADFTVTLSAASTHKVTVSYSTAPDTATQGTDYSGKTGSVIFQPGETSKTVSIDVTGDTIDEFSETFKLNLNNVDVGLFIRSQGTATIEDNDAPPSVSVADVSLVEGDIGTFARSFTVTLSQVSEKPLSVSYATADGTALAGSDYVATSGTFSFGTGQTVVNIPVTVNTDVVIEPDETFTLNLSSPVNLTISRGQATATILNDDAAGISFGSPLALLNETSNSLILTVLRKGDLTVSASVDYQTSDEGSSIPCSSVNGKASSRCDFLTTLGTLQFAPGEFAKTIRIPIVDDVFVEGPETFTVSLSNASGGMLVTPSAVGVTIFDNDFVEGNNPLIDVNFFVRQHYVDFLNREPDFPGRLFWTNEILSCGPQLVCIEVKRINVSAAFFLSIEFQETGYLVYRTHKTAFGNLTGKPVPVRFVEFLRDTQQISRGVQVGFGDWQAQLEANKQAYALAFVQRAEFQSRYPNSLTAVQFVDQLDANAGGVLSSGEKLNLVSMLGATPEDFSKRALVLRAVAEDADLKSAESNKAFVLMQYFGYLRRNPDDAPNADFAGFNFWLGKLEEFHGNFIEAEMVKAFISSDEYRQRFGP